MAWATEVLNRVLDEVANVLNVKVKNADTEPIPTKVTNDESDPVNTKLTGSTVVDSSRRLTPISEPTQLTIPTYDGSGQAVHPSVVYIPNAGGSQDAVSGYKWWMAMTPYPDGNDAYENPSILASNDGINWEIPEGLTNPIEPAPTSGHHSDTELFWDGSQFILYYNDGDLGLARKTSADGISWSESTAVSGVETPSLSPSLVKRSATEYLLWKGSDAPWSVSDKSAGFKMYTSSDGLAFAEENPCKLNIKGVPWHPAVIEDETGFHCLLSAHKSYGNNGDNRLYYGHSKDGVHWLFDASPVLSYGIEIDWVSKQIYRSCMVPIGVKKYRVYISAQSLAGDWHIGYFDAYLNAETNISYDAHHVVSERLLDKVSIDADGTVWTDGTIFTGTPYHQYSLSVRPDSQHDFQVQEGLWLDTRTEDLYDNWVQPATDLKAAGADPAWNSDRRNVVAPVHRFQIRNNDAVAHTYSLVITKFPGR